MAWAHSLQQDDAIQLNCPILIKAQRTYKPHATISSEIAHQFLAASQRDRLDVIIDEAQILARE